MRPGSHADARLRDPEDRAARVAALFSASARVDLEALVTARSLNGGGRAAAPALNQRFAFATVQQTLQSNRRDQVATLWAAHEAAGGNRADVGRDAERDERCMRVPYAAAAELAPPRWTSRGLAAPVRAAGARGSGGGGEKKKARAQSANIKRRNTSHARTRRAAAAAAAAAASSSRTMCGVCENAPPPSALFARLPASHERRQRASAHR